MNLLVVFILVTFHWLTTDGEDLLGEGTIGTNDDADATILGAAPKIVNFYEEEPESFVDGIEDFFPERYIEDQLNGESSGSKML